MKSDHTEGGLLSNLELTGNRLLLDRTLAVKEESTLKVGFTHRTVWSGNDGAAGNPTWWVPGFF